MRPTRMLPILVCAVLAAGCTDDGPDTSSTQQFVCDSWPALSSTCYGRAVVYQCSDGSEYFMECRPDEVCLESGWARCEEAPVSN